MGKGQSKFGGNFSFGSRSADDPAGQALFLEQASSVESLSTIASLQTHCQMEAGHNSSGVPESMNTESSSLNDGSQYLKCEGNLRIDGSCPRTFGANSDDTNCESAEDDHPELSNSTLQSSVKVESHESVDGRSTVTGTGVKPKKSSLKKKVCVQDSPPVGLTHKLTVEDWSELVSYICTTVEQSLQSSYPGAQVLKESLKHVRINDLKEVAELSEHSNNSSEESPPVQRHRNRRHKERPNSLPPLELDNKQSNDMVAPELSRLRSKSQEEYLQEVEPVNYCEHGKLKRNYRHHHHTRRRKPKSKAAPVDVSLDDNCPGLPENRYRHRYCHQHTICDECFQEATKLRRNKQRCHKEGDLEEPEVYSERVSVNSMTLNQLKKVALELNKLAGHSCEVAHASTHCSARHSSKLSRRRNHISSREEHSMQEDISLQATITTLQAHLSKSGKTRIDPYFLSKPRTGRESPATDMSVVNLTFDSTGVSPVLPRRHLHQHSHHHYHHIIHHSHS